MISSQDILEKLWSLSTSWNIYLESDKRVRTLHNNELNNVKKFHVDELKQSKQIYLRSLLNDMKQHELELEADIINAVKENERDMYDQKNKQIQTMIIANSIMLTALISILIQSIIPNETPDYSKIIYVISGCLSLGFLIISTILYVYVIKECTTFMDERGQHHKVHWTQYTNEIKQFDYDENYEVMIDRVFDFSKRRNVNDIKRYIKEKEDNHEIVHEIIDIHDIVVNEMPASRSSSTKSSIGDQISSIKKSLKRQASKLTKQASKLTKQTSRLTKMEYVGFEEYYVNTCQPFDRRATIFYYIGTILMLVNLITYNHAYFYYSYKSIEGATVSTAVISISLLLGTVIICGGIFNTYNINHIKRRAKG